MILSAKPRRLTGLLGLGLLFQAGSVALGATPAFVQEKDNQVTSGKTSAAKFSSSTTAGNLLVVYLIWDNTGAASVTDSLGNTYTSAVSPARWSSSRYSTQIFYATNVASGADTVTATFATAVTQFGIVYAHEYSGVRASAPLDITASATGTSGSLNSGSAPTSYATDLIFAGGVSANTVSAAGSGFTARSKAQGNMTEDRVVSAVGSYSATATNSAGAWAMQMAVFKGASGTSDTTPPTVPTGLAAVSNSTTQITLSWTASTDSGSTAAQLLYSVYRNGTRIGTTAAGVTSYADTGLTASTAYSYTVLATDPSGNSSAQTAALQATTLAPPDTTPPSAPTKLTVTGTTSSTASLSWTASTDNVGVTGYKVFRAGVQVGTATATSYTDSGLAASTSYSYTVSAFDAAGNNSAKSSAVSAKTLAPPDTTPPSVPTGLAVTGTTASSASISWKASTDNVGVTGYKIYRAGVQVGTSTAVSYTDSGLASSTTYAYTVSAFDAAGNNSATSAAVQATTLTPKDTTPPSVPTGLAVTGTTASSVSLSWTASTDNVGVTGYKVFRAGVQVGTSAVTSYTDSSLTASTNYAYTVSAFDAVGNNSAQTAAVQATTQAPPDTTPPSVPTGLAVTGTTASSVSLSWTASTDNVGVTGYKIFRAGVQVGTSAVASYTDSSLTASTNYAYTVSAFDAAGNNSAQTAAVQATTQAPPDTTPPSVPTGLAVTGTTASSVSLSWTASTDNVGVTGYKVFRAGVQVGTSAIASYTDSSLTASTYYAYTVSAFDAAGNNSAQTAAVQATTQAPPDTTPPTVSISSPANAQIVSGTVSVAVTASDNVGVAGVQFKLDGVNLGIQLTAAPYTFNWDTTQSSNGSHVLTAVAADAAGNNATSSAVTVTVNNITKPYSTSFPFTESPISEGGIWTAGQTTGVDWADVQTTSGLAFGTNAPNAPESVAILKGSWGANQMVQATVQSLNQTDSLVEEVELRLRSAIAAHSNTGYDIKFRCSQTGNAYVQILALNGPLGNATTLFSSTGAQYGIASGSVVKAIVIGNVITAYINGVAVAQVTDSTFAAGNPGIGVFLSGGSGVNADYGFTSFTGADGLTADATPSTPSNLSAGVVSSSQINLSWNASTDNVGIAGYQVFRNNLPLATSTGTSYADQSVLAGVTYTYTVAAFDGAGNTSLPSSPVQATAPLPPDTTPPTVPNGLIVTSVTTTSVSLSWAASSDNVGVAGYRIYRAGVPVGTTAALSYTDGGLPASTTYVYTVSAFDAAGNNSAPSPSVQATTQTPPDTTPPSVPTGLAVTGTTVSSVSLSWNASTDNVAVTGYTVYRAGIQIGTSAVASYTDASLTASTTYAYTVSASDAAGNNSGQSTAVQAATQALPDTTPPSVSITSPVNAQVVSGTVSIAATASDNVGVAGVQFQLDGTALGASLSAPPYSETWDTTQTTNGPHVLTAVARDAAGNVTTSSAVAVSVSNVSKPYSTSFPLTENPISEGGSWRAGFTGGVDWADVQTTPGLAFGTSLASAPESVAILNGSWGPNQMAQATVQSLNQTDSLVEEVELRLRSLISTHSNTGYDIKFRCSQTGNAYVQILALNGPLGSATTLWTATGTQYGLASGNVVKATVIGNVITVYINGVQLAQVTDSTFQTGNPGMGFVLSGGSGFNADFGFTNFTASDQLTADTTPPSTPANLSASVVSSSQINLSWNVSTDDVGVAGYQVFRNNTQIATTPGSSYSDASVIAGIPYTYAVAAFDAAGNTSPQSSPVQATPPLPPDTTPPSVPTGLAVIGTTTSSVSLSWSASSDNVGVTGYKIYRAGVPVGTSAVPGYTDGSLAASTTYAYTVSAFDAAGNNSAPSTAVQATTQTPPDTTPPSVPTGLAVIGTTTSSVSLSWSVSSDNVGVTGYKIYRAGVPVGTSAVPSYTDGSLAASTTYAYTVSAFDAAGNNSAPSVAVQATTQTPPDTTPPSVPTGLAVTGTTTSSVSLSWTASSDNVGVTGYRIYRAGVQVGASAVPTYTDSSLTASTTYAYTVSAFDAAGNNSAPSVAVQATTQTPPDTTPPSVPTGLAVTGTTTSSVTLSWTASSDNVGVTGYAIFRAGGQVGTSSVVSYTDSNLTPATNYTYSVAAFDAAGNTSGQSMSVSATTSGAPPPNVSVTLPSANQVVSGMTMMSASATGSAGVVVVQFQLDGANVGAQLTNAPYATGWNTSQTADGSHVLTAVAVDALGNRAVSSGVTVMVNNTSGRTYTTNFPLTENPISEAGNWISGGTIGLDWGNVQTTGGTTQGVGPAYTAYSDPTAVLTGNWGPNQTVTATVYSNGVEDKPGQGYDKEVEIRLRTSISAHSITGYEINCRTPNDSFSYIQIVRWNGALGDFTSLNLLMGTGCANGDVLKATISGSTINAYVNGTLMLTATDSTFTNGSPGLGFNFGCGTAYSQFGFSSYTATDGSGSATDTTPPSAPPGLSAAIVSLSQINLSWSASFDAEGVAAYQVFKNGAQIATTAQTSYSDSNAVPGIPYTYTVAAVDFAGNVSSQSAPVVAETSTVSDITPPSVPSNLQSVKVTSTSATIAWSASTDNVAVAGYRIYRNGTQVGTSAASSYTDTGLARSTTYDYTVAAYDNSNNVSNPSNQLLVTTAAAPVSPPSFVQVSDGFVSSGLSVPTSLNVASHAGNTLVVYVLWDNPGTATVTDTAGNVFTSVSAPVTWGTGYRAQVFYASNITGGADTVTAALQTAATSFGVIYALEYAGISPISPVDVTASASGSSTALNSGSVTTTSPNDLIFGAGASLGSVTAAGSGFVSRDLTYGNITEDRTAVTTGAYSATATQKTQKWVMQVVAFRAAQ